MFERLGDESRLAAVVANRVAAFADLSRYDEALADCARAARVYKSQGDEISLAKLTHNRGTLLALVSRYEEALVEYTKAAGVFEKLGEDVLIARAAQGRGSVLRSLSRYEEALLEFETARRVFDKHGDGFLIAKLAVDRGYVFESLGRLEDALAQYDKAVKVFEGLNHRELIGKTAHGRGTVLLALARYEDALVEYEKAAAHYDDEGKLAKLALDRGTVLRMLGNHKEAIVEYEKAAEFFAKVGDDGHLARVAENRGNVLRDLGRCEESLAEYDKAAKVFEMLGHDEHLAGIAWNTGEALRCLSRHEDALDQYAEAAARIELVLQSQVQETGERSSASYRERFRGVIAGALRSAAAIRSPTAAQGALAYRVFGTLVALGTAELIAERGRLPGRHLGVETAHFQDLTLAMRQTVAKRDAVRDARLKASAEERSRLEGELSSIVETLRKIEIESAMLIDAVRQRQQVYVEIQYPKAATVEEVQAELEPSVALLEFAVDGGEVFAFVTTRNDQHLIALGEAAPVLADVEHSGSALGRKGAPPPDPRRLRSLGSRILDPLLALLPEEPKIDTLLIAANGDLARIPFEILLLEDPKEGSKASEWSLLLSEYDMAYVHSGTVMRAMRLDTRRRASAQRTGPDFVAFGFPFDAEAEGQEDVAETGLFLAERADRDPLPGTAAEVAEISKLFAADEAETKALGADPTGMGEVRGVRFALFLRNAATEKALKEDPAVHSARILHLACHGEADLTSPALSRLVLARSGKIEKATGEDGFVYPNELRDLGITAELLVLSACETNAGKLHPLEGITGLSRAGLAAGADSVISTFWRVDDEAARSLMVDFYQRWQTGGMTRIAALSAAKRAAIQRGLPMKTWSAYALWDAQTR